MADDGFITPPPGLLNPDSGTHRKPRPERTERIPNDEIVFVPAVPGVPITLPAGEPAPAEITAPPVGEPVPVEPPAVQSETLATAPIPTRWRLTIPGLAAPVYVDGAAPLFLGRAPVARPDRPGAAVLAVPDPDKSVSKTHAMLEVDAGELLVHDLNSTNGVWVVPAGGEAIEVEPGTPAVVPVDGDLELGDVVIRVELA